MIIVVFNTRIQEGKYKDCNCCCCCSVSGPQTIYEVFCHHRSRNMNTNHSISKGGGRENPVVRQQQPEWYTRTNFGFKPTRLAPKTVSCYSNNHHGSSSYDGNEDDGGDAIAAELSRYAKQAQQQHLDLLWSVSSEKSTTECQTCHGTGEVECQWCHGTGALTVGDTLFCDNIQGCRHCPVCNGLGFTQCMSCKGAGKRASWMKSM